jgi:hypothetical protein
VAFGRRDVEVVPVSNISLRWGGLDRVVAVAEALGVTSALGESLVDARGRIDTESVV